MILITYHHQKLSESHVTNLGVILLNILNLLYPHDQSQIYPDLKIQQ
jgi:hypothetical protein